MKKTEEKCLISSDATTFREFREAMKAIPAMQAEQIAQTRFLRDIAVMTDREAIFDDEKMITRIVSRYDLVRIKKRHQYDEMVLPYRWKVGNMTFGFRKKVEVI